MNEPMNAAEALQLLRAASDQFAWFATTQSVIHHGSTDIEVEYSVSMVPGLDGTKCSLFIEPNFAECVTSCIRAMNLAAIANSAK